MWATHILIACFVLLPTFPLYEGQGFRLEWLFVPLLCRKFLRAGALLGMQQIMMLSFCGFILVSTVFGWFVLETASLRDLIQIARQFYYFLIYSIFSCSLRFSPDPNQMKTGMLRAVGLCGALSGLLAVQQYLDLGGINESYIKFVAPTQAESVLEVGGDGIRRPVGMVGNPNVLSYVCGLGASASAFLIGSYGLSLKMLFAFSANLAGVILSHSRTGLVCLILSLLLLCLLSWRQLLLHRVLVALVFVSIAGAIVIPWLPNSDRLFLRHEMALAGEDESFAARVENWTENLHLFQLSPVLGVGPAKGIKRQIPFDDNEWLLLLRSYGILGTLYFALMLVLPPFFAFRRSRKRDKSFLVLYVSVLLTTFIYMIPCGVYDDYSLMPFLLVFASVGLDPGAKP
jgi:O-antigen ligase